MKNLNNKQLILTIGGAIISAIGASICCLGPAVLAILGLSSAGLFSKFEGLRPYLTGIVVILLASAFYLTYRKVERKSGRILGIHVLIPYGGEAIHKAALLVKFSLKVPDVISMVDAYPTFSEAIKLCCQSFIKDVSKLSCCAE